MSDRHHETGQLAGAGSAPAGHPAGLCAHGWRHAASRLRALDHAAEICARRGVRLTPIRRKVLEALYANHRPLGAYDVVAALTKDERSVAPITIYRALDFLREQGLVHRLESRNAFVACPHRHRADEMVVFLLCETCGGVDEMTSEDVRSALDGLAAGAGFSPQNRVIELTGLCEHCRTA